MDTNLKGLSTKELIKEIKSSNREIGNALDSYSAIVSAVEKRFPTIDPSEANQIATTLMNEIAKYLKGGSEIGFVKKSPDGTAEIKILTIKEL